MEYSQDDSLGWHPRWVDPFYLTFGNLIRLSIEQEKELAEKARLALEEISDEVFFKMLHQHNWRPRTAAGWLIALSKKSQFLAQICTNLLKYPQHTKGNCFALYRIDGQGAIDGLVAYLNEYLKPEIAEDVVSAEGYSVQTALAVLEKLDESQEYFHLYYPDKWNVFVKAFQTRLKVPDELIKNIWSLERSRDELAKWIEFTERYFPDVSA